MTAKQAIEKYSEAATVVDAKGLLIRDGNWQPIARALRHFTDTEVEEHDAKLNGDTVIVVQSKFDQASPPAPTNRAPFMLVVK